MEDWKFAQKDPSECLARLYHYSVTKKHACGEVRWVPHPRHVFVLVARVG